VRTALEHALPPERARDRLHDRAVYVLPHWHPSR
jgi:hypothetical protein